MTSPETATDDELTLSVRGMTCGGCCKTVERVLRQVTGVSDAVVDLETERAHIRGYADPEEAIVALRAAGFEAAAVVERPDQLS